MSDEFQPVVDRRRADRMAAIDRLSPEMRGLVHDYGYTVVKAFLDIGVIKPRHIKHLVETVLDEFSPTRGSFSSQGVRTPYLEVRSSKAPSKGTEQ